MKKILLTILATVAMAGCLEDKGSYDYLNVNKPTVTAILDSDGDKIGNITVRVMSPLQLTPVISESIPGTDDGYTYLWYIYRGNATAVTISEEKDLDWEATAMPGLYTVVFEVTNSANKVMAAYKFNMQIVEAHVGNLMIANNVDDIAALTVFTSDGLWIDDAYESSNGAPAGSNAVWVGNGKLFQATSENNSLILCDDGEGGASFANSNFGKVNSYGDLFYEAPAVIKPQAYYCGYGYYGYADNLEFIVNDGKLHYRVSTLADKGAKYGLALTADEDYSMIPDAICANGSHLFYDKVKRRFYTVQHSINGDEVNVSLSSAFQHAASNYDPSVIAAWDPDDVGLDMIYYTSIKYDEGYAIMRDPADPGSLYRLKFFAGGLNGIDYYYNETGWQNYWQSFWKQPVSDEAAALLANAEHFTSAKNYAFIYYSVGPVIYLYDAEGGGNRQILDVSTILPGHSVDHLYIQDVNLNMGANEPLNRRLFVAASPTSGSGRSGTILDVKLMTNGEYESHTLHRNVVGKVVSMSHQM